MSWGNVWIGFMGGGFGASAIIGASYYSVPLFNMGVGQNPIHVAVFGRRLGLTLQAEAAAACCIMTGIPSGDRFQRMESSGVDWSLGAGFDIGATVQHGSEAIEFLAQMARSTRAWSIEERAKNLVRALMGDIDSNSNEQNFVLLPLPGSLSIGAGLWYEWSDVLKLGHNLMWQREPPRWALDNRTGQIMLRMDGIPLQDGDDIEVGLTVDGFGVDDRLAWNSNGNRRARILGQVWGQKLYPFGNGQRRELGPDGVNISSLQISGRNESHMFSTGTQNGEVVRNDTLSIGVLLGHGGLDHWESDDYCEMRSDANGRLSTRIGHGGWRD